MSYGAFQTSVSRLARAANGLVVSLPDAYIDDKKVVETAAGIGLGVLVSRGTDPEKQVVVGADTVPLGIVVRAGDVAGALGDEEANDPVYQQYEVCPVIRDGTFWAYIASGSASAGSTTVSCTNATGVLKLGAASGASESDITGLTLETTMTGEGIALFTLDKGAFTVTAGA